MQSGKSENSFIYDKAALAAARDLCDYAETAKWLGISISKLRKDVNLGKTPRSVKMGKSRRFRPKDIEAFIEQNLTNRK